MIYKTSIKPGVQRSQNKETGPRMTRSFDAAIHNKRAIIRFIDGTSIEGVVTRYSAYWLEVKLNDGRVLYVNKGPIKMIEVVEEKEGKNQGGGFGNEHNKPKQR